VLGDSAADAPALDEIGVADKLESFRKMQKDFVGLSFGTISAAGPNAAGMVDSTVML